MNLFVMKCALINGNSWIRYTPNVDGATNLTKSIIFLFKSNLEKNINNPKLENKIVGDLL